MNPEIVSTQESLDRLLTRISTSDWLAVDTEFMRESSYYPDLCLIQLATPEICTCIDIKELAEIEGLVAALRNTNLLKIFHSARQDLEVLYADYNIIPSPIFDTQIAASIISSDEQISYGELVSQIFSVQLSKTESRTDWCRRPLTAAQIAYALDDVRYLGPLYQQLSDTLEKQNRMHWLLEECEDITRIDHYEIDPVQAWKQVKGVGKIQGQALKCVMELACWREKTAQTKNRPRQWILPDRALVTISQLDANDWQTAANLLESEWPKSLRYQDDILKITQNAETGTQHHSLNWSNRRLTKAEQALVKDMMKYIRNKAQELGTTPSLLANRKSIENLVLGKNSKVLSGWRKSQIGEDLSKMLDSNN